MRGSRQGLLAVAVVLLLSGATVAAATLTPAAVAGWGTYLAATERRIGRELAAGDRFLAQDFAARASANRRALLGGAVLVDQVESTDDQGRAIDVPSALVHHWRGAIFIPGVKLPELLEKLQSGAPAARQEDVLQSKVLERQPDRMRVFLRVQRTKFVTVVYNTEHTVTFRRVSSARATSASTATKIAEVESPNTPQERELRSGDDRGGCGGCGPRVAGRDQRAQHPRPRGRALPPDGRGRPAGGRPADRTTGRRGGRGQDQC